MSPRDISEINYFDFDRPEITSSLFHPRPEYGRAPESSFKELSIPAEENINIGARFYPAEKNDPIILFFHGNGEIVADYDAISAIYTQAGANFFPVDYRGYGKSDGTPTVTAMMRDCHKILDYAENWLRANNYAGPLLAMGRSLGSASALELAATHKDSVDGLIIESGFAFLTPLLQLIGLNPEKLGLTEAKGVGNYKKIKFFDKPTLIIHAEYDNIIPLEEGKFLYENSPDPGKNLLIVPGADHNNIFALGVDSYMEAVQNLLDRVK